MRSHVVTARAPRAADRPSLARRTLFALACASGLTAAQPAAAAFWSSDAPPERATAMAEGAHHSGPRAHRAMCARAPALCAPDIAAGRSPEAGAMPAVLDTEDWRSVRALNLAINERIRPRDDIDIYGVSDHWADGRADGVGDCEDYIIAKKLALLATGRWRADQLLYAVVRSWRRGYHAVLILRTDRGDFVLDNLRDSILSWEDSDYDFVIRQSAAEPMRWVTVTGAAAPVVAGAPDGSPMQVAAVGR